MKSCWVIFPLFIVVFLDTFGGFFISPLVNSLFYQTHAGLILGDTSIQLRNFYFGLSTAIFFLSLCLGSPIMGKISDHIGRKKTLLLALGGSFIGYVISILALWEHNVYVFILGRIIDGFSGGSLTIAQASVADVSDAKNKAVNMGYLMLAMALGIMLGPVCGGVLSDPNVSSHFNVNMPFYFATLMTLGNWLLLAWLFREPWRKPKKNVDWRLFDTFKEYVNIPKIPRLLPTLLVYLSMQIGWGAFMQFMPVIMHRRFGFTSSHIGLYMGVMGVGCAVALGVLIKPLVKRVSKQLAASLSLICLLLSLVVFLKVNNGIVLWLTALPMSIGIAIGYSMLNTLVSDCVASDRQGWIMGVTSSLGAIAMGLASLGDGIIADFGLSMPVTIAIVFIAIAILIPLVVRDSKYPSELSSRT